MTWHYTREAEADIINIYRYGARTFGTAHADAYHDRLEDILAAFRKWPRNAPLGPHRNFGLVAGSCRRRIMSPSEERGITPRRGHRAAAAALR